MKKIEFCLISFIFIAVFNSCLVSTTPHNHYFIPSENEQNLTPKLIIFSTPRHKNYIVTNVNKTAQVFIKSPIFENPETYYLMRDEKFYENEAKQYQLDKKDKKFYQSEIYKTVTLKILENGAEKLVNYTMLNK